MPLLSSERMHVACGADERYVPHLAVMLQSLCQHASLPVEVHVMDGGLPEPARAYLRRVVEGQFGQQLSFLALDAQRLNHLRLTTWFSAANYYRILLPELLPDLQRVLYLDADIAIADDLAPLWRTPFADFELAAVVNVLHPKNPPGHVFDLGLKQASDYFNSGVLLMDLAHMRANGTTQRLLAFAGSHPELMLYADQDALNGVFAGRWQRLHPRWNVQTTMLEVAPDRQPLIPAELADALGKPAVIHYMGSWKPWRLWSNHPLRGVYRQHYQRLPRPVHRVRKNLPAVLEYYFPGWVLAFYWRWRLRLAAVKRRIKTFVAGFPSRSPL